MGWIFFRHKVAGAWLQGNFYPDDPSFPFDEAPDAQDGCPACHGVVEDTIFTIHVLRRFINTATVEEPGCSQPGNTPCPAGTYN